jgi:hypothetical protein
MLIRVFKSNHPGSLLLLPIIGLLFWSFIFFTHSPALPIDQPQLLYSYISDFFPSNAKINGLIAVVLIILEALYLNYILSKQELFVKNNHLPALLYMVLFLAFPVMITISPVLISNFFLLVLLDKVLTSYKRDRANENFFDAALVISISSLFYFPTIVFLPFVFIAIGLMRSVSLREFFVTLAGFVVPYLFVFIYHFYIDSNDAFFSKNFPFNFIGHFSIKGLQPGYYYVFYVISFLLMISLSRFLKGFSYGTIKTRRVLSVMITFLIFSIFTAFISSSVSIYSLGTIVIAMSIYFSNFFLSLKKKWFAELLFLLLLFAIIYAWFVD